jgi:hypothetical protein
MSGVRLALLLIDGEFVMRKLLGIFFPLLSVAGCGSVGGASMASGYVLTAHCYTHDYTNIRTGGCSGHTWH